MLRSRLPSGARKWVDAVRRDPDYIKIKKARHALTHARLKRHFKMNLGEASPRGLKLQIGRKSRRPGVKPMIEIRALIELASDVATKHVIQFFRELPNL
jgi:hypothetical protein